MTKQTISKKYKQWPLAKRLWLYQLERIPLVLIAIVAGLNVGVIAQFSDKLDWSSYLRAVLLIVLYMVQIRASDEKKDFEHDNKYHTHRPVQRGLVTLAELYRVNIVSILLQLAIYLSFHSGIILLVGIASQTYAFLTRKEFFIRDWLRGHFHLYNFTHYIQLLILQSAILAIMAPSKVSYAALLGYAVAHASLMELGRKIYSTQEDTTDDSYSAQLGLSGAAATLSVAACVALGLSTYLVLANAGNRLYLLIGMISVLHLFWRLSAYVKNASITNSKKAQFASAGVYVGSTISVILGLGLK